MAPAVRRAFMDVFRERSGAAADGAAAQAWLAGLREDQRYLEDIWAGPPSPRCPARRPPRSPRRRLRWRGTYRLPGALPGPLAAGELGDPADRRGRRAEHRDVPVPGTQPQLRVGMPRASHLACELGATRSAVPCSSRRGAVTALTLNPHGPV